MRTCHFYQTYTVQSIQEIETLNVCTEEKKQFHDILNIMTRSMSKQTDVPSIYPLKGEHKKPEHVKQLGIGTDKEVIDPNINVPDIVELPEPNQLDEPDQVPLPVQDPIEPPVQKPPPLIQQRPEIYPP